MDIQVQDLCVSIGGKTIIKDIHAEVKNKELVGIIGPNGSGKSTMLKTIYRALKPSKGGVLLDGKPLTQIPLKESAQRLGVMTQMSVLNFDFKVEEVVLMGRTPHKKMLEQDTDSDWRIVEDSLKKVGMETFSQRQFNTLSGGEQQRVLMARALAQQPKALILDEPTNHLDIRYQLQMLDIVKSLQVETFAAMHDLNLAATYCDKLYVMSSGAVVASGTPNQVLTPELILQVFGVKTKIETLAETKTKNIIFLGCSEN